MTQTLKITMDVMNSVESKGMQSVLETHQSVRQTDNRFKCRSRTLAVGFAHLD